MNINGSCISFPFRTDERGAIVTTADKTEQIRQAIGDILETRKGERAMLPDYGIPDFVFSVVDGGFAARLAFHLKEQITRYVPLVETVEVKSELVLNEAGELAVLVRCTERGQIDSPRNLTFPVWKFHPPKTE